MSSSDESASEPSPRTPITFSATVPVRVVSPESQNLRDSMVSTSSSLYPQSTSTESYPESSIHPRSFDGKDGDDSSFSPRIVTQGSHPPEFDVDDVSYRLRLLVNNSYFLPPAHSKPSPLSLAPPNPPSTNQRMSKQVAPALLDFFRMGKSKSKPVTPAVQSPTTETPPGPILRTTSDSTTASGYLPKPKPTSAPQTPAHAPYPVQSTPGSRVVVLRERMDDLIQAAKQSERDIKLRTDGRNARSHTTHANSFVDDVIDPTDAVDLPPPSAGYPFAVQASAMHGLGPQESLGAAILADRLPPSSPGMWSSSSDDTWRKAILHEAVSLSLNESPESSFATMSSPTSSEHPIQSPSFRDSFSEKVEQEAAPSAPKVLIGQRIVEPGRLELETGERAVLSPLEALHSLPSTISPQHTGLSPSEPTDTVWRPSTHLPRRAETPAATMPLTPPPPRKQLQSPSGSGTPKDVVPEEQPQQLVFPTIEKLPSTSSFHEGDNTGMDGTDTSAFAEGVQQRTLTLSPPMIHRPDEMPSFSAQLNALRASPFSEDDDLSSYVTPGDMGDETPPRPSMTISLPPSGRPSMSEYSNPSPTASAFQDAVFGSCRTPSPLLFRRGHSGSLPGVQRVPNSETETRNLVSSPPPRTSSSLGPGTNLPPPPRTPASKPIYRSSTSSASDHLSDARSRLDSEATNPDITLLEPSTPPSLGQRREHSFSLSLRIPTETIAPPIHTAPAPASPTDFFDRIQSHPNAMDDLDTSDEESDDDLSLPHADDDDEEEIAEVFVEPRTQAISNRASSSSSRPSIMRLGNHSTPQLAPGPSTGEPFSLANVDPKKPIGNVPERGTYFASRKKGKGPALMFPPFEAARLSHDSLAQRSSSDSPSRTSHSSHSPLGRPHTAPVDEDKDKPQKLRAWQRESIQRFDGMLLDHIAAEREAIKRITSNISNSQG
ncbi:hypothetical protein EIP86_007811 [Pleurotus ostreatoroseus]|nr:hypothetical protein EIP86_007811 [Pleurotus ostreatoroseus]